MIYVRATVSAKQQVSIRSITETQRTVVPFTSIRSIVEIHSRWNSITRFAWQQFAQYLKRTIGNYSNVTRSGCPTTKRDTTPRVRGSLLGVVGNFVNDVSKVVINSIPTRFHGKVKFTRACTDRDNWDKYRLKVSRKYSLKVSVEIQRTGSVCYVFARRGYYHTFRLDVYEKSIVPICGFRRE